MAWKWIQKKWVNLNTAAYERKSVIFLGPEIWNSPPEHLKAEKLPTKLQNFVNPCFGNNVSVISSNLQIFIFIFQIVLLLYHYYCIIQKPEVTIL